MDETAIEVTDEISGPRVAGVCPECGVPYTVLAGDPQACPCGWTLEDGEAVLEIPKPEVPKVAVATPTPATPAAANPSAPVASTSPVKE